MLTSSAIWDMTSSALRSFSKCACDVGVWCRMLATNSLYLFQGEVSVDAEFGSCFSFYFT